MMLPSHYSLGWRRRNSAAAQRLASSLDMPFDSASRRRSMISATTTLAHLTRLEAASPNPTGTAPYVFAAAPRPYCVAVPRGLHATGYSIEIGTEPTFLMVAVPYPTPSTCCTNTRRRDMRQSSIRPSAEPARAPVLRIPARRHLPSPVQPPRLIRLDDSFQA